MADQRFDKLTSDPRYRLPSRKESRTVVDPRFKRLFTDQDFRKKAKVDRYGRRVERGSGRKELEKLYRLDKGEVNEEKAKPSEQIEREVVGSSDEESSVDDEELVERKDPAREGGFSDSSSEEESTSEEELEGEAELAEETAGQEQTEDIPMGEVSCRIAAVNLDWDNIRATDIMAVAASFVPNHGNIEGVTIYPSDFGRERLQREELEGPPRDIFASSKRDAVQDGDNEGEESEDEEKIKRQLQRDQINEGEEFDSAKLRQYQLERLRYYYAVITCDTHSTAKHLYDAMDGREYLSTANFFDLRFIPDSTSFDEDRPRDECRSLPDGYKPNEFRTEALTHSKVRLTWDDDDTSRKEVQKRAFSRAEMDENDLLAYIGSEESDAGSVASRKSVAEDRKVKKKEAERRKMRAALGLAEEMPGKMSGSAKEKKGREEPVGDMQITFTSGLSAGGKEGKGVFENEPQDEESTRARYIRKERERKLKRKDKMKAGRSDGSEQQAAEAGDDDVEVGAEDAGFDDPFFTDPSAAAVVEKRAKNAEKKKKLVAQMEKEEETSARRAELELLMAPEDQNDDLKHFDMREIEKVEKAARRKGKKRKKSKDRTAEDSAAVVDGGFQVETQDPRFMALFDSHEFAIDPTNPKFKGTQGMRALLEEGRVRKRKRTDHEEALGDVVDGGREIKQKKAAAKGGEANEDELKGLVARLKGGRRAESS